jgi:hypothetical protein
MHFRWLPTQPAQLDFRGGFTMKKLGILTAAVALLASAASAQTPASQQTNASSNTQASATAEKSGVQAQSNSSASASQQAQASREPSGRNGAQASGSASSSASNSTSASADAGPASLGLANGSTINAELLTALDARKSKPGDRVVAKTTEDVKQDGKVVLRKGSRLIGHVTQAQAKGEGSAESSLGIVFEQADLRHGQEVPIRVLIQALAAAQTASSAGLNNDEIMGSAGGMGSGAAAGSGREAGGLVGGAGSTVNGTLGSTGNAAGNLGRTTGAAAGAAGSTASSATGNVGGLNAAGQLTSTSTGAFGLQGLHLNSDLSNATQGSVVTSPTRNIHLASGTQLLLRAVNR